MGRSGAPLPTAGLHDASLPSSRARCSRHDGTIHYGYEIAGMVLHGLLELIQDHAVGSLCGTLLRLETSQLHFLHKEFIKSKRRNTFVFQIHVSHPRPIPHRNRCKPAQHSPVDSLILSLTLTLGTDLAPSYLTPQFTESSMQSALRDNNVRTLRTGRIQLEELPV
ncbi:hypothetical protein Q7C36_012939 [Tachysurus vachellii]|uniref:Uncharacterized protein n=1 Tax=Tachysurus vachellii TaxID=175792 RepID=A0AA88MM50_TACVA|nr:hypothetical protein Q7C36_012939 [Tachysurus vachellii]